MVSIGPSPHNSVNSIYSQKELERRINQLRPNRLVVLSRLPDGTEREMSAPELVEAWTEMVWLPRGNFLDDVRLILEAIPSAID